MTVTESAVKGAQTWTMGSTPASGLVMNTRSGGIGENSPEARAGICEGLAFLGITLDENRNQASEPLITTDDARTHVRVIRTDEELVIASATASFLA
jgi:acetate kinase